MHCALDAQQVAWESKLCKGKQTHGFQSISRSHRFSVGIPVSAVKCVENGEHRVEFETTPGIAYTGTKGQETCNCQLVCQARGIGKSYQIQHIQKTAIMSKALLGCLKIGNVSEPQAKEMHDCLSTSWMASATELLWTRLCLVHWTVAQSHRWDSHQFGRTARRTFGPWLESALAWQFRLLGWKRGHPYWRWSQLVAEL